jgi:hypothetical protein
MNLNLSLANIITDGLVLSFGLAAVILGSLYYNPRLWLQDNPPEIQARVAPMTPTEKRQQRLVGVLFLLVVIGVLFNSINRLHAENNGVPSLLTMFLHIYGILLIANLFDALILDYLLFTVIKPKFVIIPGSEDIYDESVHSLRFHILNFFKGCIICAVLSGVIAGLIFLF